MLSVLWTEVEVFSVLLAFGLSEEEIEGRMKLMIHCMMSGKNNGGQD